MNVPAVSSLSSVSLHGFLVAKAYFSVYVRFTTNLGLLYMPGCSICPAVRLPGMPGCPEICPECPAPRQQHHGWTPNDGPQVRRWQRWRSRRATARDGVIKRARFQAAPAASPAGRVGRRVNRNIPHSALKQVIPAYYVKELRITL